MADNMLNNSSYKPMNYQVKTCTDSKSVLHPSTLKKKQSHTFKLFENASSFSIQ